MDKKECLRGLQTLRNIGPKTAEELYGIGIRTPAQVINTNPEELYERLKRRNGGRLDRCVLYQFRGAKLGRPWPECKDRKR